MKDEFLISDTIVFDAKPIAVPYNYRISYKISQLVLILSICSPRGGCSLIKLHMISTAFASEIAMKKLYSFADDELCEIPVIRFDPAVNRALLFAISECIIIQQKDGKLKLSQKGKQFAETIMESPDLMVRERAYLSQISKKITEKKIQTVIANWRYQDATN